MLSLVSPVAAHADGMAAKYKDRDRSAYELLIEHEQVAYIMHEDGVQRMLLAIDLDPPSGNDESAVWIVPVRGESPVVVNIDLLDGFPRMSGRDPVALAQERLGTLGDITAVTQIYPGCILSGLSRGGRGVDRGATVERWGIRSEVLNVSSIQDLSDYIAIVGPHVDPKDFESLSPYCDDRHVFVVSWIASPEEFLGRVGPDAWRKSLNEIGWWPSLAIEFPTEEVFFPLRASRVYGDLDIPVTLYVEGFVEPAARSSSAYTKQIETRAFKMRHDQGGASPMLAEWLGVTDHHRDIIYTRVRLETTADAFTQDLELSRVEAPTSWAYAALVNRIGDSKPLSIAAVVLYAGLVSCLASGLTGLLVYRRWRPYVFVGLGNLLTIVGYMAALVLFEKQRQLHLEERQIAASANFLGFVHLAIFSALVLAIGHAGVFALSLPLLIEF